MALATDHKTLALKDFLEERPNIRASSSWADTDDDDIDDYFKQKPQFADTPIQGSKSTGSLEGRSRSARRRDRRNRNIILSKSESDASSGSAPSSPSIGRFIVTDPGPSDPARAQIEIGRIRSLLVKDISSDLLVARTINGIVCICDRRDIGDIKRVSSSGWSSGTDTDKK